MMFFTSWVATVLVAIVVGVPLILMVYGLLFNQKLLPAEARARQLELAAAPVHHGPAAGVAHHGAGPAMLSRLPAIDYRRGFFAIAIPVAAAIGAGVIIFLFSRILLSFNKETTPPVALAIAIVILIVFALVASRYED